MAILRNQRTYPLSLKSATQYALNNGLVAAYDFQGDPNNAYAGGDGVPHVGAKALTKPIPGATLVQVTPGIAGRDPSAGRTSTNTYNGASTFHLGIGSSDGLADFTVHKRMRTPSSVLQTYPPRYAQIIADGNGAKCVLYMYGNSAGMLYFRWEVAGTMVTSQADALIAPGTLVDLHLVRAGDVFSAYVNGKLSQSITKTGVKIFNTQWNGLASNTTNGISGAPADDLVLIDDNYWNRALSAGEVFQHQSDPYAGYANTAVVPDGVTLTNPFPNATISSEGALIAGYFAGSTVPTGIEYRFNGGSWTALTGQAIAGGAFSGTTAALSSGTGTFEVRFANATSITTSAANITAKVPDPSVTLVSQPAPDGQSQAFSLTTTRADSVTITLTPNGNGAVQQGPTTFPVTSNAVAAVFTAIPAGDYKVTITATGPGGTATIPGNAISILGVSGGGETIVDGVTPALPKITAVTVTPGSITLPGSTGVQFAALASGTNSPPQTFTWSAAAGQVSVSGFFTPPPASSIEQKVTVTATSTFDPTQSGSALVTIPAIVTQPGPGTTIQLAGGAVTLQQNFSSGGALRLRAKFTSNPAPSERTIYM